MVLLSRGERNPKEIGKRPYRVSEVFVPPAIPAPPLSYCLSYHSIDYPVLLQIHCGKHLNTASIVVQ
jgi:hypothetical protein